MAVDTGFDARFEENEILSDFYTQRELSFGFDFLHVVNAVHSVSFGPRWTFFELQDVDAALYVDAGDVSVDAWSFTGDGPYSNVGMGFMFRAENFPVRFDAAVPLNVPEGDSENERGKVRLSFSVGYRF